MSSWTHRIDAVPRMRASVDIMLVSGHEMAAMTVPATAEEQSRWQGIGDWIAYVSGGKRYIGQEVAYWRYRQ